MESTTTSHEIESPVAAHERAKRVVAEELLAEEWIQSYERAEVPEEVKEQN